MAYKGSMTLDELVKQLTQVYGSGLRTVVLYGSAASGEHIEGKSDQNVLVIVERIDRAHLQKLAQTARSWTDAGNPPPLTLTQDEWRSSADIFPMEYADILERHRVLSGVAPFDGIQVLPKDLRLQVEREAMATLLKLRTGVMSAGTDTKRQSALMADSLSALMVVFRAVMRLAGEVPPREYRAVAQAVATLANFDAAPLNRVIALARDGRSISDTDTAATLDAYVSSLEALVKYLDGYSAV
ncbi:MAG: nucleotidyltransferase domain-containing protein [Gemmatimonadaceae bacterium]